MEFHKIGTRDSGVTQPTSDVVAELGTDDGDDVAEDLEPIR
jgi:hypothetical protein